MSRISGFFGAAAIALGACPAHGQAFIRGDVDQDGRVGLADAVRLLQHLYTAPLEPPPGPTADANDDGAANLADVTYLLRFALLGGAPPAAPWPAPGEDPTPGPGEIPEDAGFRLALSDAIAVPAQQRLPVVLSLSSSAPVAGIQAAVAYDPETLILEEIEVEGTDLAAIGPEYVETAVVSLPDLSAGILAVLVDFATPYGGRAIPAGDDRSLAVLWMDVREDVAAPLRTTVGFHASGIGDPPTENVLDLGGRCVRPVLAPGTLRIEIPFVRGDTNADDRVDIADAIYLLAYIFLGGDAPGCGDAADANNDGMLDVADAVFLINYLFIRGPQPSEPFPVPGIDPDPDALGCGG